MESRYSGFSVLDEADRWDAHTRTIVEKRLQPSKEPRFLTDHEWTTLTQLAKHLLFEDRKEILAFVVSHIDQRLYDRKGEAQRKPTLPSEDVLVRIGIKALDLIATARYDKSFHACDTDSQFDLVSTLQLGKLEAATGDDPSPDLSPWMDPKKSGPMQKALFKKLLGLMVDAHASHPTVWSEMGYAGPAYPRGYYRIGTGLTDPWEPRSNESAPNR